VVGLLLALLVTVSVPVRLPAAVGVNVTVTVHEALTASVPQLFVSLKSPVTETPEILAEAVPVLVTVTDVLAAEDPSTVLGKVSAPGFVLRTGPAAVPVPERLTVLVTPPATTVSEPERLPEADGVKVTLTEQLPFAAIDEPQLLVSAKSPVVEMEATDAAELVELVTATVCAPLVVPLTCEPKFSALGLVCTPFVGYGG
jgi:hypothetical protein